MRVKYKGSQASIDSFKSIRCFKDLIQGVEHCNGTNQHANFYTRLDNDNVQVLHFYRYGKRNNPYTMSKVEFDTWLKGC